MMVIPQILGVYILLIAVVHSQVTVICQTNNLVQIKTGPSSSCAGGNVSAQLHSSTNSYFFIIIFKNICNYIVFLQANLNTK